jgi:metallo-beta-lactamase family protein
MLQDSGYIQEKDEEYYRKHLRESMLQSDGPLYTQQDAGECMQLFRGCNVNEWFPVVPGVRAQLIEAGHIVGAVMVVLEIDEEGKQTRLGFSGDLGRSSLPIIRDPAPMPPVDILLCESTYGNRAHEDVLSAKHHLRDAIIRTARRGGKVFIPAFSLERTQEIVYDLHMLWDAREIPAVPIVIDSPLATRVTEVFMKHPECYDKEMYENFLSKAHNPFQFSLVRYTATPEESKALNTAPGPMIIMAGSGMCEAGRIRHHLRNGIEDEKNTVLAVGFMAQHTLGRKVVDPEVTEVKIFDRFYRKRAEVVHVDAYSGHADMADLDHFVTDIDTLKTVILVHGELTEMEPFALRLKQLKPNLNVLRPEREEVLTF